MPVHLHVRVINPLLSSHEALQLRCTLHNDDDQPRTIPSPYDRSGSLQIGLFQADPEPLRVMNRQTRQFMMSEGRVDSSLDLDTLEAGQSWDWEMNLASFHLPIPPGDYLVRVAYTYEPEQIRTEAPPQSIRVAPDPLQDISRVRDNPIIDGLAVLMEAQGETGPEYFLRLHNYDRPFGSWWSAPVLEGENAIAPFLATANFYQTQSSEPFHRRWVLWTTAEGKLGARCYDRGEPTTLIRAALLPPDSRLIRCALRTLTDELYVFTWQAGTLTCYLLDDNGLQPLWTHAAPVRAAGPESVAVGGDETEIHVAYGAQGIVLDRLTYAGQLTNRQRCFSTSLHPYSIEYEPSVPRIKAMFIDSTRGKMLQMAVVEVNGGVTAYRIDRLPFAERWKELSFDQDRSQRFHLAISTVGRKLYYCSENRGPVLVAEGEERFFPVMVAPLKVYVGCYRKDYGYRFVQYQRRRQGSKIVGLAAHA